jgi:predicted nucleic-acid-binding protein
MIAVDTNIIIRLLTHDDARQHKRAYALFTTEEVFIADTVIMETEWVLRYAYKFTAEAICDALVKLFGLETVHLPNPQAIAQAIEWHRVGVDFSDAIHLSHCQKCEAIYTFDKAFVTKARNLSNCVVTLA